MEAIYMPPAQAETQWIAGAGMPGGRAGQAGRASPAQDGFTQLFAQLVANTQGAGDVLPGDGAFWVPLGPGRPDRGKVSPLDMLMAMLGLTPTQVDFRQYALTGADGALSIDIDAIGEIAGSPRERLGEWIAALEGSAGREAGEAAIGEAQAGEKVQDGEAIVSPIPAQETQAWQTEPAGGKYRAESEPGDEAKPDFSLEGKGMPLKVLGYQKPDSGRTQGEETLAGQEQFRQAVQEVRGRLAEKGGKTQGQAPAIVLGESAYRTLTGGVNPGGMAQTEGPSIGDQIFLGLSQNLPAGKGEFVVKLVPEGLGEITVKLLTKEGKTTLRLITASAETARLINHEIGALQNALKPIQVEVREAVPQAGNGKESDAYFSGFDQFNGFGRYANPGGNEPGGAGAGSREADDMELFGETVRMLWDESEMDLYI